MDEYDIVIRGRLDERWMSTFEGMEFGYLPNGYTRMHGMVRDQAALFGLINTISGLGLKLVLVHLNGIPLAESCYLIEFP